MHTQTAEAAAPTFCETPYLLQYTIYYESTVFVSLERYTASIDHLLNNCKVSALYRLVPDETTNRMAEEAIDKHLSHRNSEKIRARFCRLRTPCT